MQNLKRTVAAALSVSALTGPGMADSLEVGRAFPNIQFLHVAAGASPELATWSDVAKGKTIAFIFASW